LVSLEQALEKPAVVGDLEMQEFVDDNGFLKAAGLPQQLAIERDSSVGGTGCPLVPHALNADLRRSHFDPAGPASDFGLESLPGWHPLFSLTPHAIISV
jgi:hypothetical protein